VRSLPAWARELVADLERSNRELERFAYEASHDLAEPLRGMVQLSMALTERYADRFDDTGLTLLRSVSQSAERMEALIRDLLEHSRVGREPLARTPVCCETLLVEVVDLFAECLAEKQAHVFADPLPVVMAHRSQLRKVFINLLCNALKFAGDEPPEVRISAERDGECWHFSVADNGIGIPPHHHDRVFEPFKRLHSREDYSGSGIGLTICRRIVERHGGRIWVESGRTVRGTVFHFTIPDTV
jgi:light-regulated signal transduction histidine kinase (bacteriophytochrome)